MSEYFRKYLGQKRENPIRFRCSFHNTIYDVLKAHGYKETDSELDWDFFWCDKEWIHEVFDHIHLLPHQRVNHFRNHYELTRKDLLVKNIKRAQRQAQRDGLHDEARQYGELSPSTYVLPLEYSMFAEEFRRHQSHGTIWIMKPVGRSQGKGIFLFDKLNQVANWKQDLRWMRRDDDASKRSSEEEERKEVEPYVVQRYLSDPLLIGGKKFDLRLYALVTGFQPLVVYLYRSGFARFSHSRYSTADLSNQEVHLTNVAVQKHSEHYDEKRGGKWDLQNLKVYLTAREGAERTANLYCAMEDVVLYALLAVQKVMIQDKHCFEMYGYDIMISSDLKPWLIEVNASPSLTANTESDYEMKFGLLDDVLTIIDPEKYLTGNEVHLGGFDLIYRNGARVRPPPNALYRTYLGCCNHRREQMHKLACTLAAEQERQSRLPQPPPPPVKGFGRGRKSDDHPEQRRDQKLAFK